MNNQIIHNWDELPVVLTTQDVALILGCTPEHVAPLCQKGNYTSCENQPAYLVNF